MRHRKSGRKLNRTSSHREAMFRNMVTSLLEHERIFTTLPKAKELRRWGDWMITLGKRGDLHARRQALSVIRSKDVVHKLFTELAQRFQNRAGGYTRIVKVGYRRGDAAPMCLIELVEEKVKVKKPKAEKPAATVEAPPKPPEAEAVETVVPEATEAPEAVEAEEPMAEAEVSGVEGESSPEPVETEAGPEATGSEVPAEPAASGDESTVEVETADKAEPSEAESKKE